MGNVQEKAMMRFSLAFLVLAAGCAVVLAATPEKEASRILRASGVRGGLVVHVGSDNGQLTAALRASDRYLVQGLDRDLRTVEQARTRLAEKGIYGKVTVNHWQGERLPYIDNLVDLLVVGKGVELSRDEIMRVLSPRGVACVKKAGEWKKVVKPWPDEIDEWTHWLHGPDNVAVSKDRRVGISRSLQWYMPPRWSRHHNLPAGFNGMVTADGRVYYLVDEAPNSELGPGKWALVARDAFNGLVLWRKPIKEWGMEHWGATERFGGRIGRFHGAPDRQVPRRIVAANDLVFVTPGFHAPVVAFSGATGETVMEYPQTKNAGELLYRDGILFVARNTYEGEPGKEILAVDVDTGETLWKKGGYRGIAAATSYQNKHTNAYLTLGEKNLFMVDGKRIVALRVKDGSEIWEASMPLQNDIVGDIDYAYSHLCTLAYKHGMLYFAQIYPGTQNMNRWEMKKLQIEARDAATGELAWDYTGGTVSHVTPADLFIARGKVWTLDPTLNANGHTDGRLLGLDCFSGEIATSYDLGNIMHPHHHRCYRNKATENYMLMGEEGIEYVDFGSGEQDVHYWVRGACRYGIMPANGFVYVTPHNCACYLGTLLHGLLALKSQPAVKDTSTPRLHKGPAYGRKIDGKVETTSSDWPTFRGDSMRSCYTAADMSDSMSQRWQMSLGGELTPPVVVGQSVFVASPEREQVYCLDAANGEMRWRFVADGSVNTPPSYHKGMVVFGTRSGSLYCVTADEGELAWRLRVAPSDAHLVAFGHVESPWPLNGSPLVMDGKIYCVAGRSMHLDGGLYVSKVDFHTGELLQQENLKADTEPKGEVDDAVLPDVLVSDGQRIYMKSMYFQPDDISQHGILGGVGRRGSAKKPDEILRCSTEMVDESSLNCCFWEYKNCIAQQLVFDAESAYGANGPNRVGWGGSFSHDIHKPGKGYSLKKWIFKKKGASTAWGQTVPVRPQAMLVSRNILFLAGVPDRRTNGGFWSALKGKQGGLLRIISKDNGKKRAEYKLESPPVYNGLAAGGGALFMTLENGSIVCYGNEAK